MHFEILVEDASGKIALESIILADTPEGPSFFILEKGIEGLVPGKHEDKHGIRASNTTAVTL